VPALYAAWTGVPRAVPEERKSPVQMTFTNAKVV
jgi:hypothetical protein